MPSCLPPIRLSRVLIGLLGLLLSVLLTSAGAANTRGAQMKITLLDVEGKRLHWTTAGPGAGTLHSAEVLGGGFASRQRVSAAVVSATGQETYYITGNGGTDVWLVFIA